MPKPEVDKHRLDNYGLGLWRQCKPVSGIARDYLVARGCVIPPADGDLRWNAELRHPSRYVGPALVALVTHFVTREPMTLHRTWICPDGKKANVAPARLLLPGHSKMGGVIRLWPDETVARGLGIAEGIETALAAANVYSPVWAAIDAGNLAALPVCNGVDCLAIYADHDAVGLRAARSCARRWRTAGREVAVYRSRIPGEDIADVAQRRSVS